MPKTPKYEAIKLDIQRLIYDKVLRAGDQLDSEAELAARYKVSTITIKRALHELVAEGRVNRIRGKGSFVSSTAPGSNSRIIYLVYEGYDLLNSKMGNTIIFNILKGVQNVLDARGYLTVIKDAQNDVGNEQAIVRQAFESGTAGLLIYPTNPFKLDTFYEKLAEEEAPFVLMDRYIPWVDTNVVATNNFYGAVLAVKHLVSLHHRKIGFISYLPLEITSIQERLAGYKAVLRDAGIEENPGLIWISANLEDLAHSLMDSLAQKKVTALFCANDSMAVFLIRRLLNEGISIPGDISVVGFDDILDLSLHPIPLTTVHQASFEIGREAAELLLEVANGNKQKKHILVSPKLTIRSSCAEYEG